MNKYDPLSTGWTSCFSHIQITPDTTPKGAKLDTGKPQMWLVPLESIRAIATLMTKALDKYPDKDNWKKIENGEERYLNALLRHLCEIQEGIDIDEETGLPHAYAVGANALFYLYHYMKRQDDQDINS